ncbi:MAG TPA: hypothetical protein VLB44_01570 [Kofleriaceae bacterium]|nr:hypothetical protein [Kofleriaceae bacterium]
MRTNRLVAAIVVLGASASPALAEDISGTYEVKFEEMSTNCNPPPVAYTRGSLRIDVAKSSLRVNIDTIPQMAGIPAKSGKINAKTIKKAATTVQGLDGKYGISGRVDDNGVLQLVLVAEYTRHEDGKPFCTQSWNVSGVRGSAPAPTKPADKAKPKSMFDFMPTLTE